MQPLSKTPIARQVGQPQGRAVDLIVIHCSATPNGRPLRQGQPGKPGYLNAAQVINAWHAARGFKRDPATCRAFNPKLPSIGYHFVIDLTGEVFTGRGRNELGAHALDFNAHSVGICMVGGLERDARYTLAQWASLRQLVASLLTEYAIPCVAPRRVYGPGTTALGYAVFGGVCGHRDLAPDKNGDGLIEPFEWLKTCPGFSVADWVSTGMTPEAKNVFTGVPA